MKEYKTNNWWGKYFLISSIIFALVFFFVPHPSRQISYLPIFARIIGSILFIGLGSIMFLHHKAKKFAIVDNHLIFTQTFLSSLIPSVKRNINIKDIHTIRFIENLKDRANWSDWDYRVGDIIIYFKIDQLDQQTKFPIHEFKNEILYSMFSEIMEINPHIKLDKKLLPYLSKK